MCEETVLTRLNERYIESFLHSDVDWYGEHLAEDFLCIESHGSVLDKAQFLRLAAEGPTLADFRLQQLRIRIFGDVALINGEGSFRRRDWTPGTSRYTAVYRRNGAGWKAVSVQVTHALHRRRVSLL